VDRTASPPPLFGKSDGIDRSPLDALRVEELVDARADNVPLVGDGVIVYRASFASNTIRFRARAFAPGWARLVDAGRVAGQAVEVLVRGRVVVGEAGRVRDYDVLLGLPVPVDVELGETGEWFVWFSKVAGSRLRDELEATGKRKISS